MSNLLSFITVPLIGLLIDSWQSQAGYHKTIILILSLGVLLGLLIIPQAGHLAVLMCSQHPHWLEAALIAGAVCLMNLCSQVSAWPICIYNLHINCLVCTTDPS